MEKTAQFLRYLSVLLIGCFLSGAVLYGAQTSFGLARLKESPPGQDCSSSIGGTRTVNGKEIGLHKCEVLQEKEIKNASRVPYRRIEVALSGCIEGFTVKTGPGRHPELMQFSDVPEHTLGQEGNLGPYFHGVSCYSGSLKESGLTLFLPASSDDWNGKLFVLFHGGSPYPPIGELSLREPGVYNPLTGDTSYAGLMIDKGYAVAYTRRSSHISGRGDMEVILDDHTELQGKSHKFHLGLLRDWTELTQNFVAADLGSRPERTYWYGKSGGAAPGRLFNYVPGANRDSQGRKLYDGMLLDDSAGGWYLPTFNFTRSKTKDGVFSVQRDSRDHFSFSEAHKEAFAFQIDITHLGYVGNTFVEGSYPIIKRQNARLLVEKGLSEKSRHYEIVGVSHADAGAVYPRERWQENLDLSGVFDALIDGLDRWVEHGIEPPATRSDMPFLGDVDGDGLVENPAIQLPEIACPTGVYYEFPPGVDRSGRTGFVPYLKEARPALNADTTPLPDGYDESWLEPLNSKGRLVDMNGNGVRDNRESLTQAWQRRGRQGEKYGTLEPDEELTLGSYVACVSQVASNLVQDGLLSEEAMVHYIEESLKFEH